MKANPFCVGSEDIWLLSVSFHLFDQLLCIYLYKKLRCLCIIASLLCLAFLRDCAGSSRAPAAAAVKILMFRRSNPPLSTLSLCFIRLFIEKVAERRGDIEARRLYPPGAAAAKTTDRNRRPGLRAHFHFNQSACWFSWR